MRHLLVAASVATFAFAVWANPGQAHASPRGLTSPGVPVTDAGYTRRSRNYYAAKDYRYRCEGGGWAEIRELQRFWPQQLWPPSMRCFPYR